MENGHKFQEVSNPKYDCLLFGKSFLIIHCHIIYGALTQTIDTGYDTDTDDNLKSIEVVEFNHMCRFHICLQDTCQTLNTDSIEVIECNHVCWCPTLTHDFEH